MARLASSWRSLRHWADECSSWLGIAAYMGFFVAILWFCVAAERHKRAHDARIANALERIAAVSERVW